MTDRRGRFALPTIIAVLVAANIVANSALDSWAIVLGNVIASALLIRIAGSGGVTIAGIGIDRDSIARGWQIGRWFLLATSVAFALGVALPWTRDWFEDERVRTMGFPVIMWRALITVPFGTVLLEELAFRGVLPALFARRHPPWRSYLSASLLFGAWHVLPAWDIFKVNPALRDVLHGAAGRAVAISFGVVSTAVIGVVWCWLRYRSRSLVTTMIAHAATNSLGYVFSYLAWSLA
jgi:membrane protease YdiL (CAAX protease family)